MTPLTDAQQLMRRQLLDAGVRTVGFSFDGGGDSGSLEYLCVPDELPSLGLDAYDDLDVFLFCGGHSPEPVPKQVYDLVAQYNARNWLEDVAYAALEYFDGDWVNNDGGFGIVAIDLQTGAFRIEGHQRFSDTSPACSNGSLFEGTTPALVTQDGTIDVSSFVKNLLEG